MYNNRMIMLHIRGNYQSMDDRKTSVKYYGTFLLKVVDSKNYERHLLLNTKHVT